MSDIQISLYMEGANIFNLFSLSPFVFFFSFSYKVSFSYFNVIAK